MDNLHTVPFKVELTEISNYNQPVRRALGKGANEGPKFEMMSVYLLTL